MLKRRPKSTCARCRKNGLIKLPDALVEATCKAAIEAWVEYDNLRARGGYPEATGPVGKSSVSFNKAKGIWPPYDVEPYTGGLIVTVRYLPPGAAAWFSSPGRIEIDPHKVRFYEDRTISPGLRSIVRHELRHFVQFCLGTKGPSERVTTVFARWDKPKFTRGMPPKKIRGKDELSRVHGGTEYAVPHAHAVRDIEFHTRLGDEVEEIEFRVRRGYIGPASAIAELAESGTFRHWKQHAPAKYKHGLKIAAHEFQKANDAYRAGVEADRAKFLGAPRLRGPALKAKLTESVTARARKAQYAAARKAELERLRRLEAQAAEKARQEATARKALTDQLSGQMKTRAAQAVEIRRENDPFGRPAFFVYRDGKKTTKYAYSKEKAMKLAGLA